MQSAGLQDCRADPHFTVIPIVGDGPTQSLSVDIVDKPESKVPVPNFQKSKTKVEKQNLDSRLSLISGGQQYQGHGAALHDCLSLTTGGRQMIVFTLIFVSTNLFQKPDLKITDNKTERVGVSNMYLI